MSSPLVFILFALGISIAAIVLLNRYLNLHAFFCLIIASLMLGLLTGKSLPQIFAAMQSGFGSLLSQIGFIVALGSCLGIVMEKTGSMEVISQKLVYAFGARKSIPAMSFIGLIVGIPVFCDSGFIILSRIIPAIAAKASVASAPLALSLSTGLYTSHTLVPPTPGPLAAAANLGIAENLGSVILVGIAGSLPVSFIAFLFSRRIGQTITTALVDRPAQDFPDISVIKAFLPLVVPILLITLATLPGTLGLTGHVAHAIAVAGQPVVALIIGLILAFTLITREQKNKWQGWISEALKDAGIILLITGAGGAFGYVIRESGIDLILREHMSDVKTGGIVFLFIAFLIAAVLKTAQGSTTSSMIITSSLLAPLALSAGFKTAPQLSILILAIGGGAMTVSHANDSYFWVVSQFGGFSPRDTFKSFTLITFIQGVTALLTSMVLFIIW